ncbi:hypothetical protein MVEN_00520900 [Mycena venus]|uniref:Uncharacterized protein n=1 Tax=Mycena venus TaxID=2733690 RepID=A0A8H7D721_9AGAR|nr:hypothetical protein MVEN_00520900 [Mycena venus]
MHTPPRTSYDSPMLTPSPLRTHSFRPRPITPENTDAAVFLASPSKPLSLLLRKKVLSRTPLSLNTNTANSPATAAGTKRKQHTSTPSPFGASRVPKQRQYPLFIALLLCQRHSLLLEPPRPQRRPTHTSARPSRPEEVVEASSPGGHITKRRARSRPVSQELLEGSPSPVAFPSTRASHVRSSSASSSEAGSPLPRRRLAGMHPPRAPLERIESAATLFFGPVINPPLPRARLTSAASANVNLHPTTTNAHPSGRHSYAGPGAAPRPPSPRSSPIPVQIDDDEQDMFFSALPSRSDAFSFKQPAPAGLGRRAQRRDDDDVDLLGVPCASTSVSSIYSDEGLVTPGVEPEAGSGWPSVVGLDPTVPDGGVDVDAFIQRTLAAGAKASGTGQAKKAPGTPVKKVKTSYLIGGPERPWQSAVAHKVGLPGFSWDGNGKHAGGNGKPRKSLPAVFPALQSQSQSRKAREGTAGPHNRLGG